MIPVLDKGKYFKGLIEYHEKKVEEGVAELIDNSTLGTNKSEYTKAFMETMELNKRVVSNKAIHVSLSLAHGEFMDNDKFLELTDKYMKHMGYENCPRLVYRHYDKDHQHLHVVTTSVDLEGKKIKEFKDHEKSEIYARVLEKEFGLKVTTSKEEEKDISNKEYQASQYSIHSALTKNTKILSDVKNELNIDLDKKVFLRNDEIRGKVDENKLDSFLKNRNITLDNNKQVLKKQLDVIYKMSSDKDDFYKRCELNGLYAREIGEGKNKILKFGLGDKSFYCKGGKIDKKYQVSALNEMGEIKLKSSMRIDVQESLKKSISIEDMQHKLSSKGIEMKTHSNSGGIYGVSFVKDGKEYKATELDRKVGVKTIMFNLEHNFEKKQKESKTETIKDEIKLGDDHNKEKDSSPNVDKRMFDEDDQNKKRKKKRNNNLEM